MIESIFFVLTEATRVVVFVLIPALFFFKYKDRRRLLSYIFSLVAVLIITYSLKYAFSVPRPPGALIQTMTPRFPSGHTAMAFAPLLFLRTWKERSALLIYALIVAYTRLFFNVHLPVDLFVSFLISVSTSYIVLAKEETVVETIQKIAHRFMP